MTLSSASPLPNGVQSALSKLFETGGYNLTIGNDGSVEILKNYEIVHSEVIPDTKDLLDSMVTWLIAGAEAYIPKGLKIPEPDLDVSIYTMTLPGALLGCPDVDKFVAGIYGKTVSPEAAQKGGYIVFKPE